MLFVTQLPSQCMTVFTVKKCEFKKNSFVWILSVSLMNTAGPQCRNSISGAEKTVKIFILKKSVVLDKLFAVTLYPLQWFCIVVVRGYYFWISWLRVLSCSISEVVLVRSWSIGPHLEVEWYNRTHKHTHTHTHLRLHNWPIMPWGNWILDTNKSVPDKTKWYIDSGSVNNSMPLTLQGSNYCCHWFVFFLRLNKYIHRMMPENFII